MAKLRSKDVLQIDATIIAGLLILLTVQSFTSSNFDWKSVDEKTLEIINQQIPQTEIDYQSALKVISQLKDQQKNITDKTQYDYIQRQIDDTALKLYQAQAEQSTLFSERDKLLQKGVISPVGWSKETWVKVVAITMVVPFAASAGWEILDTFGKNRDDERASRGSKISMIIGFIILLFGLGGIEQLLIS